ncbi:DUF429 domain-containing protein [Ancylobacter defluvii]|uniref:DUF429 domain-containing protein n=1 Tax=Ancylobacter defluvii TaxID=1282440 RepID=A0A9W6JUL5_9HYPH|nr:DUF429 domain-containing protein [Ancylobacter defluvii]MBS7586202.1 DUF429 domain-containing protein [Ancylobacter defluvii]GLK82400.1 hypothetical protein GCM10017653_04690 [Ancylobacter defluvii]
MSAGLRVAGVDGCPRLADGSGGWVAVIVEPGGGMSAERITRLTDLIDRPDAPQIVAVDMPIGLPERIGPGGRAPERLVRPKLGDRQSSVFSIPSRAAVYAALDESIAEDQRYRHACSVARASSQPPRAVSKQAFHIFGKIAEIDRLLRARPALAGRIHECHPEVSFWAMNGGHALDVAKKVRNAPYQPGLAKRRELLAVQGFEDAFTSPLRARALKVGEDDLIDACAAAWTAGRIARGQAVGFPVLPERDGEGLPIQIQA